MKVILFSLLILSTIAYAGETVGPWNGSYDKDPEYYHANSHHSDCFSLLAPDGFANYFDCTRGHLRTGHDHRYIVEGDTVIISCMDYENKIGEYRGFLNEDFTEIHYPNGEVHYLVSRDAGYPGRVEW